MKYFILFLFSLSISLPLSAQIQVTNTMDSGAGSLRQAILTSNANPQKETIEFNIPGTGPHKIELATVLPKLEDVVIIDGRTQPGFTDSPIIHLDGSKIPTNASDLDGLHILANKCEIYSLCITEFPQDGIDIESSENIIEGCYIGVTPSGNNAARNSGDGIEITGSLNVIKDNVSSANNGRGVHIQHYDADIRGDSNIVIGNFLGTNATGTTTIGNLSQGVAIFSSKGNQIGGAKAGEGNVISGSTGNAGILIFQDRTPGLFATGNIIAGNLIGTDITGTIAIPNNRSGIVLNASENIIGLPESGGGNLISGNKDYGILLERVDFTPLTPENNIIQNNIIGLDKDGAAALGNQKAGIALSGAKSNMIGGKESNSGNLISGNGSDETFSRRSGILILKESNTQSEENEVYRNVIGFNKAENTTIPNGNTGILIIEESMSNIIGSQDDGNLIAGHSEANISIESNSNGNDIIGNSIGFHPETEIAYGGEKGVYISSSGGNDIMENKIGYQNTAAVFLFGECVLTFVSNNELFNNEYAGILFDAGDQSFTNFTGNSFTENVMYGNKQIGIDLTKAGGWDNVTPNDLNDEDSGPNDLQNYPEITSAKLINGDLIIEGQLNSINNEFFGISFYGTDTCNSSEYGEGKVFLSGIFVQTGANGDDPNWATFSHKIEGFGSLSDVKYVTSTAENLELSTSEFSKCQKIDETSPTDEIKWTHGDIAISPNPASDQIKLSFTLNTPEAIQLNLVNSAGVQILSRQLDNLTTGQHTLEIDLSQYPKGSYILQLQTKDSSTSKQFIKL